jgi:hypothetical protein
LALVASLAPAQQLRVKSADRRAVQLEWVGKGSEWIIERKPDGAPAQQKLGTAAAPRFEDFKINHYGTYRNRVTAAGGKPLNEVIVGPPPFGVPALATVMAWRPGDLPAAAMQRKATTDFPNLSVASGAGRLGMLFAHPQDPDKPDAGIWYVSSSDGKSWSKPVMVPIDGPRSSNHLESVSIDSAGRVIAAFGSNSGSEGPKRGSPMVSRSPDGVHWKTCGLGTAAGEGNFEVQPSSIRTLVSDDDTVHVLWPQVTDNKFGKGLLIWHGR